jgi:hypothetical protein
MADYLSTKNQNPGARWIVAQEISLQRSREIIGFEFPVLGTFPDTADKLGTESAISTENTHNLANHVAIVDAIEIQALDDITNLGFHGFHCFAPFVHHESIISGSGKKELI